MKFLFCYYLTILPSHLDMMLELLSCEVEQFIMSIQLYVMLGCVY